MIVGISGAAGKMGRSAVGAVLAADDLELGPLYSPGHGGVTIDGHRVDEDPEVMAAADVVVELTRPEVVMDNLVRWRRLGRHVVVGTSGFDTEKIESLRTVWGDGPPNCLVVPNFSIGAILMMRFAESAAFHFGGVEIVEAHNPAKADAPSGTAVSTAERIAGSRQGPLPAADPAPARGALISGVAVHSIRMAGVIADQDVLFGNPGETLKISHHISDRSAFMPGLLLAVRHVAELAPVSVGLEQILAL